MLTLARAQKLVLKHIIPTGVEKVALASASGRILAEDIISSEDIPAFNRSAMDGYALKSSDAGKVPVRLRLAGDLPAGKVSSRSVKKGEAVRIMTGAPLPPGADAVVMQEYTAEQNGAVGIFRRVLPGENVARRGEDVGKGERVLTRGIYLRPAEVGMLASLGKTRVKVSKKPEVAIISTGDEISRINKNPGRGKVRDANSFSLAAAVISAGGIPKRLGIARDRKGEIREKLTRARRADIILLSGGVSVGKYDLVKDILTELGVRPVFWKMRTKPGKPTFFGIWEKSLVFGLPGYPVSSLVIFELLVKPAIDKMLGRTGVSPFKFSAVLDKGVRKKDDRRAFFRGRIFWKSDGYHVVPVKNQFSGALKSLVEADVLFEIPETRKEIGRGERVTARRI